MGPIDKAKPPVRVGRKAAGLLEERSQDFRVTTSKQTAELPKLMGDPVFSFLLHRKEAR
jgi:hypothetical protein